jgi:uncharacterized protein YifE (UPF0438 family)
MKSKKRFLDETKTMTSNEKILVDLANGKRKPKNAEEKKLLKDIEAVRKNGRIVEIPGEF